MPPIKRVFLDGWPGSSSFSRCAAHCAETLLVPFGSAVPTSVCSLVERDCNGHVCAGPFVFARFRVAISS